MKDNWRIETQTIQEGYSPEKGAARVLPLYQSTTFKYDSVEQAAALFDLEEAGHMYSRISNPTVEALENKIARMEGGVGALATSSGQAASTISIMNLCGSGDHFIAASSLYGGTYSLFDNTLRKAGVDVTFVDQEATLDELKAAAKENTKAVFAESLSNPGMEVLDFEKFVQLANNLDVPLIIDNTFPTPYLCNPIKLGANIVIHSTTKYIDGHASSVGGMIIDGGNFNWNNGKYPEFTEPDKSYHGIVYTEKFGEAAYIVKARVQWLRDIGATMSPFNAYLTNHGLETLHVRMDRHCENAQKLAEFLENHPQVSWVKYPGLKSNTSYAASQKYLRGSSGVLTFGIQGGVEKGINFMNSLELAAIVVHVADVRTCVLHPASMTHRQLSAEEQISAGVTPDLIRVSVGIENIQDIIEDFEQAFKAAL